MQNGKRDGDKRRVDTCQKPHGERDSDNQEYGRRSGQYGTFKSRKHMGNQHDFLKNEHHGQQQQRAPHAPVPQVVHNFFGRESFDHYHAQN